MLCIASAMLIIHFPVFSQCSVTISGSPCTGNTLTANFSGGTLDTLKWKRNGNVVHTETRNGYNQDGITVAGGHGSGSAPNQFYNPSDVYVDAAGNVYVSDTYNNRIQKWAPGATEGVTVAGGNGQGDAPNQLAYPIGILLDADNNLYIADYINQRIQKWAPGATEGVTIAGGNGYGSGANQFKYPVGLFLDASGNLYVGDLYNDRVQKFAPGDSNAITVAGGNGEGSGSNQLLNPHFVWVDADGNVYVTDESNPRVQKWAPGATDGTTAAGGNGAGSGLNQLWGAQGIFTDVSGSLYISDEANARVIKWAPGAKSGTIVVGGNGEGNATNQFNNCYGMRTDASGNIYVVDAGNYRVQKFTPVTGIVTTFTPTLPGTYTVTAISAEGCEVTSDPVIIDAATPHGVTVAGGNGRGGAANQLHQPNGLFVDHDGNVWVADTHNGRIQKWAPDSTSGVTIGAGLPNAPSFPTTVFVDKIGNLYAADYFNSRVVKFSFCKNSWKVVGKGMDLTRGVWVDKDDNVYATDYGNNRVLKFAPGNLTGVVAAGGNGYGNALDQLAHPTSVFVDYSGNVYVADIENDRIVKWAPGATQGFIVAGGNGRGNSANQLSGPDFVFVDGDNNIYVTDLNNERIQKWAPGATQGVTVAGGNGTGKGPFKFNGPYGCIVDARDHLYVADHENDRVQRFNLSSDRIAGQGRGLCGGGTFTYHFMSPVPGTSYTWSVPASCTILSGQGTASITVSIPSDFSGGEISVVTDPATCKGNIFKDTLSVKPVMPSEIAGPSFVGDSEMGVVFSIIPQAGVEYNWRVPYGAAIVSGQGTNSVTVNWGSKPGFIIVRTFNCADSAGRKLYVHVNCSEPLDEKAIEKAIVSHNNEFLAYPNPAINTCTISFTGKTGDKYSIELTDLTGKILQHKSGMVLSGENKISLDMSKYAKAVYFITLIDGNGRRSLKLNKQ